MGQGVNILALRTRRLNFYQDGWGTGSKPPTITSTSHPLGASSKNYSGLSIAYNGRRHHFPYLQKHIGPPMSHVVPDSVALVATPQADTSLGTLPALIWSVNPGAMMPSNFALQAQYTTPPAKSCRCRDELLDRFYALSNLLSFACR